MMRFWIGLIGLAAVLTTLAAPAYAGHRHGHRHMHHHRHHYHHHHHRYPYVAMNYLHNYAPGPIPGTVITADGPLSAWCKYGASAYLGQDRRRHPCN